MAGFHPVDVHVGLRVRQRRALLGMSQTDLGQAVGLTFQQVQKYERGFNRVSASRLFEFAAVLDVPVSHFFEGMAETASGRRKAGRSKKGEAAESITKHTKRETLELVRAFYKINSATQRRHLSDLVIALAAAAPVLRKRQGGQ